MKFRRLKDLMQGWLLSSRSRPSSATSTASSAKPIPARPFGGSPPPPEEFPLISPGIGFSGLTSTPPNQGNSGNRYGTRVPIARWVQPIAKDIASPEVVGIVAAHGSGIQKVEFVLDDGPVVTVTQPSILGGIFQLSGYFVTIDPTAMADHENRELRAIVYPVDGPPLVLQGPTFSGSGAPPTAEGVLSYWFASNGGGTLWSGSVYVNQATGNDTTGDGSSGNPYASTMKALRQLKVLKNAAGKGNNASGGTIYIQAGTFTLGQYAFPEVETPNRWVTIRPAPGVAKEDVVLTGSNTTGGLRTQKICLRGLTVRPSSTTEPIMSTSNGLNQISHFWLDDCDCDWVDSTTAGTSWFNGPRSVWLTSCTIRNCVNGFVGPYVNLIRDCSVSYIRADAYSDVGCVINSSADHLAPALGSHPDVYQLQQTNNANKVLVGLIATDEIDSQGFFQVGGWTTTGILVRGCDIRRKIGSSWQNFAIGGTFTHLLIIDTTGSDNASSANPTAANDCLIRNSTNASSGGPLLVAGDSGTIPFIGATGIKYE